MATLPSDSFTAYSLCLKETCTLLANGEITYLCCIILIDVVTILTTINEGIGLDIAKF